MGRLMSGQDACGATNSCIPFEVKLSGLCGKVLVVGWGWAAGLDSVRRDKGLPPCQTQLVPASSTTDPPLDKAVPTCTSFLTPYRD